jgi:hypothetical protein
MVRENYLNQGGNAEKHFRPCLVIDDGVGSAFFDPKKEE